MAVTFVTPREMGYLRIVEETTKKRMSPLRPPSSDEALVGQQRLAVESLSEMVDKNNIGDYRSFATELLEKYEAVDVIAAALKSMTREPSDTPVSISEERPLPARKRVVAARSGGGGYKGNNRSGGGRSSSGSGRSSDRTWSSSYSTCVAVTEVLQHPLHVKALQAAVDVHVHHHVARKLINNYLSKITVQIWAVIFSVIGE